MTDFLQPPAGSTPGQPATPAAPDLQQQIAALQQQLAALAPVAARGQQALEADRVALAGKVAALGADQRAIVERLPESERAAVADQLARAAWRAPPTLGGGPPIPAGPAADVSAMIRAGEPISKIRDEHPREWAAYLDDQRPPPPRRSPMTEHFIRNTEKAKAASARGFRR